VARDPGRWRGFWPSFWPGFWPGFWRPKHGKKAAEPSSAAVNREASQGTEVSSEQRRRAGKRKPLRHLRS